MRCFNCNNELPEQFRFCPECGQDMRLLYCSSCGTDLAIEFKFCPDCGGLPNQVQAANIVREMEKEPSGNVRASLERAVAIDPWCSQLHYLLSEEVPEPDRILHLRKGEGVD